MEGLILNPKYLSIQCSNLNNRGNGVKNVKMLAGAKKMHYLCGAISEQTSV